MKWSFRLGFRSRNAVTWAVLWAEGAELLHQILDRFGFPVGAGAAPFEVVRGKRAYMLQDAIRPDRRKVLRARRLGESKRETREDSQDSQEPHRGTVLLT